MRPSTGDSSSRDSLSGAPARTPNLIDQIGEVFRVKIPPWFDFTLVVGLVLIGTAAFGVAGFLGYPYQADWMQSAVFHKPTALFVFGCLLFLVLQHVILQHPAGTKPSESDPVIVKPGQPTFALVATLVSIAIIVIADLAPHQVNQFLNALRQLLQYSNVLQLIVVLIDLYFLIVVLVDFSIRWLTDISRIVANRRDKIARTQQFAKFLSGFSNDTIAAAILALVLAVMFQTQVFSLLFQALTLVAHTGFSSLGTVPPINDCTLSFNSGCAALPPHYNPNQLPTITYVDVVFAGAMGFAGIVSFVGYLAGGLIALHPERRQGDTVVEALRNFKIRKALLLAFEAIITPLRRALWPAIVFAGVLCIAIAAKVCQRYLQLLSCQHQALFGDLPTSLQGAPNCAPAWFDVSAKGYSYLGAALAFAAGAAIAVIIAAVVQLYVPSKAAESGRQVAGFWSLLFLVLAWTVLIPVGIASVGLLIVNVILLPAFSDGLPQAFFPPGILTYASLAQLIFMVVAYVHRQRKKQPNAGAAGEGPGIQQPG